MFGPDNGITPDPTAHYGAFKLCTEGNARAYYWIDHQIRSAGLRPFTVYGPGRDTGITAGPTTIAMRHVAQGDAYTIPLPVRVVGTVVGVMLDEILIDRRCVTAFSLNLPPISRRTIGKRLWNIGFNPNDSDTL